MAVQTYTPNLGLANNFQDAPSQDTPVLADDLNREANLLDEIVFRPYLQMGAGVARGRLNQFNVTVGSGLSVVVATGIGIVGTETLYVPVRRTSTTTLSGLEANRTSSNPLYLFLMADDGTGPNPPSTISQLPLFQISDYNTLTGAVLLATITTSASAVLTCVPNPNRFAGASVSPATTTVQGIVKVSVAPTTAGDPIAVGTNDPRLLTAPAVKQRVLIRSSGTVTLLNRNTSATFTLTPGASASSLATAVAAGIGGYGATGDSVAVLSDSSYGAPISTAGTPAGLTVAGGSATPQGSYLANGTTYNGQPVYLKTTGDFYIAYDGTNWRLKSGSEPALGPSIYQGPTGSDPTAPGWTGPSGTPTVTSTPAVAAQIQVVFEITRTGSNIGVNLPNMPLVQSSTGTSAARISTVIPASVQGAAATQGSLEQLAGGLSGELAALRIERKTIVGVGGDVLTAQQAQVTVINTSGNSSVTFPSVASMYATGFDYGVLWRTDGATGTTLTINANTGDGNIIYNVGGEVSSYVANTDTAWTIFRPYMRANGTPGLSILDS